MPYHLHDKDGNLTVVPFDQMNPVAWRGGRREAMMKRLLCWWRGHIRWDVQIDHGYVGSQPQRFIEKAIACRRCGKILGVYAVEAHSAPHPA